jgi:nucleoid-associated protein YgaU
VSGVHTVASGDTLSKLAKVYLSDAGRYMDIFNANADTLKDPDVIKVGQQLNIPAKQLAAIRVRARSERC